MGDNNPRTVLEALVRGTSQTSKRPRTITEWCDLFNATARAHHEDATLSDRHLRRWVAGDVTDARPSARRVAAIVWRLDFDQLVSRPSADLGTTAAIVAAVDDLDKELTMSTEDSARWIKRGIGGVDENVLDQLHTDVARLAADFLTKPPLSLIGDLTASRREVFDLIDHRPRPRYLADLYLIAGQVCALLAHACADLGRRFDADTHARTAWVCADYAEDQHLQSYVRWVQAQIAYWAGDYGRAVQYAESGLADMTDPSTKLRLSSQLARACAAAGDERAALAATETAMDALTHAERPTAGQPGVMWFDKGKALYYASEVHLALPGRRHSQTALTLAEQALQTFDRTSPPEFVAAAEIDAARAHLGLGAIETATGCLSRVLQLPVELRTTPVVQRVSKIGRELAAIPAHTTRELPERITLFTSYTAHTTEE